MIDVKEKTLEEKIEIMKSLQRNVVTDDYDMGYYNGVEMCISLLENREPKFKPEK